MASVLLAACARSTTSPPLVPAAAGGLPADLQREIHDARSGPENDRALHAMRAASLAVWHGDARLAGEMLDTAIREIETLYTGTDSKAAEARRLYHQEREKPFKGEPYERMMAYVYRGLLDYAARDYNNAAASFRSAILQDAFADEQQSRCDFEVAEFLLARTLTMHEADRHLIEDAYSAATALAREHGTEVPSLGRDRNVLVFVEVGPAPFKVPQGEESELLVIGRRGKEGMKATLSVNGGPPRPTTEAGNLAFQAQTRGGRKFDFILAGQAYTKRTTERGGLAINQIGSAVGIIVPPAGAAIQLAGLIVAASGIGIAPEADTRTWDTLPDSIHIETLSLPPGRHSLEVRFFNQFGKHRPRRDQRVTLDVPEGETDLLVWVSQQDRWPERPLTLPAGRALAAR